MLFKSFDPTLKLLTETWKQFCKKKLLLESLRGEWWIIDGSAVFADVDVNDMSHEAYVIQHLASVFANMLDIDIDDVPTLNYIEDQIKESFIHYGLVVRGEKSEEIFDEDPAYFTMQYLWKKYKKDFTNKQQFEDAFFLAYGSSGQRDARDYGMKYLGWIRVAGNNIQTYILSPEKLSQIIRGIDDILGENIDDNDVEDMEFDIEVLANKKTYFGVPYKILMSGDVTKLLPFRQDY